MENEEVMENEELETTEIDNYDVENSDIEDYDDDSTSGAGSALAKVAMGAVIGFAVAKLAPKAKDGICHAKDWVVSKIKKSDSDEEKKSQPEVVVIEDADDDK